MIFHPSYGAGDKFGATEEMDLITKIIFWNIKLYNVKSQIIRYYNMIFSPQMAWNQWKYLRLGS